MENAAAPGDERVRLVAARYSSDAEAYRELWAPILRPHGRNLLDALPLTHASRVLDVASGTGVLLPDIQRAAPHALIAAADCSAGMLALAPREFPRAAMDARRLGFRSGVFDVVVIAFALFHFPDPFEALVEARRVMRPGGSIGVATWDGDPDFPAQQVWIEELDACGAGPAGAALADHDGVGNPTRMEDLLHRAGYSAVRAWPERFSHRYDLEGLIAIRTRVGSTKRRFESLGVQARARLLDRLRRRLSAMSPEDLTDTAEITFATAQAE